MLNGCWIVADAPLVVNGVTTGSPAALPLPIPTGASNLGIGIFTQCLGLDLVTLASSMSKGFATSIGQ